MALSLRTKPHTNSWLCLSPRVFTLGEDAFEHAPAVIKEIHAYLRSLFNERKLAGGMMLQLMQDVNTMLQDRFQADILATRAQYERSDAILGGMGVGWTPPYFLSTCYPRALSETDRELRQGYSKTVNWSGTGTVCDVWSRDFCEGTFECLHPIVGGPEIGWTLTLIAMTYGRLRDLFVLLRYPEQLQGASREFNAQLETPHTGN